MSIDIGGLVLHKLLEDPSSALEAWAKLKIAYFSAEYTSIYTAIVKYYSKFGSLPSFDSLELSTRDTQLKSNIKALRRREFPQDVSIDIAVSHLIDEFAQSEALSYLSDFVDNITLLDVESVKGELSEIVMRLEEKTHSSDTICLMSDIHLMELEELNGIQVPLGFNNKFDAEVRASTEELIMVGGRRGSGKSVVGINIFTNQYEIGNVGLYFSIEMTKHEVFNRSLSILSGVSHDKLRKGIYTEEDLKRVANVRANMFDDSEKYLERYINEDSYTFQMFEKDIISNCPLKRDNQLIIVDNQRLTLADIDVTIQKFKTKFNDKLKVVVVDYVNQIEIEDIYNWKQQISLSKQLKNFARKYGVVMVTPYQIDNSNEARFSKGILDAADIAMILDPHDDHINFTSTKTRNTPAFNINSHIDWSTLRIDPQEYIVAEDSDSTDEDSSIDKASKVKDVPF